MVRLKVVLPIAALAALGAVLVAALALRSDGRPTAGSRLRVLFSGETLGEIEPCNCSGKMAGGLPARGGYIEAQQGEWLLLDTGCIGSGTRDFEVLRTEAALHGMKIMGYDAANIGETELWLGCQGLRRLVAETGVPLTSANVRATDDPADPAAPAYRLFRRSGLKVAVTGVVESAGYQVGPGLAVESPSEALGRLIPRLRQEAGVIIVLADLQEAAVRQLAADFPEITLILFRGRGDSHPPELVNRTTIASIYGDARYLGDLALAWDTAARPSTTGKAVLLDEAVRPSPRVAAACVDWYKTAVRGRKFDLSQPGIGWQGIGLRQPEPDNRYVGSDAASMPTPWKVCRRWGTTPRRSASSATRWGTAPPTGTGRWRRRPPWAAWGASRVTVAARSC
jgi:2',3'-cyclic-nucleotide 2'-phosphodiesterase (5'-nucleotidase family)